MKLTPINLGITLGSIIALSTFIGAMDNLTRWWESHNTAYAAKEDIDRLTDIFEDYLVEQKIFQAELRGYTKAKEEKKEEDGSEEIGESE